MRDNREIYFERIVQKCIWRFLNSRASVSRVAIDVPYCRSSMKALVGELCFERDGKLWLKLWNAPAGHSDLRDLVIFDNGGLCTTQGWAQPEGSPPETRRLPRHVTAEQDGELRVERDLELAEAAEVRQL